MQPDLNPAQLEEISPKERLLMDAPARPKLRERATIERAITAYMPNFKEHWGELDYEQLQANIVTTVESTTEPWAAARWMEALGWSFTHASYLTFVGYWRSMETARIAREVEWVTRYGARFPATEGQTIVFSRRGARLTGVVKGVDRTRARAFVEARRLGAKPAEFISVDAEFVLMVEVDG